MKTVFSVDCVCRSLVALAVAQSVACAAPPDTAQPWFRPETNPAELKRTLQDDVPSDRWIYHDLNAARAAAEKSGKPILAVFRCVPCGSAPKLDEQLSAVDSPLAAILDRFVCVRVVKMNGVDRNVFDFDRDVPYVAMILNADGTVYGRWGTRTATSRTELPRHTLGSLQTALERAAKLHEGYPANRAALAGKSAAQILSPPMPDDMPTMKPHPVNPPEARNCIHCHMVGEANLALVVQQRPLTLRELWPYPTADNVGIRLDVRDGLKVKSVISASAAERAGVRAGDVLESLAGAPLISEADVQWVLDHAADDAKPKLGLSRDGRLLELTLELSGAWRRGQVEWRESLAPARPHINVSPENGKAKLGIGPDEMALSVSYPREGAAKAGFKPGDVIISVDGRKDLFSEADFLKYIHVDRPKAHNAELVVLRKGAKLSLTLPLR